MVEKGRRRRVRMENMYIVSFDIGTVVNLLLPQEMHL